jgi:hypothetical protein
MGKNSQKRSGKTNLSRAALDLGLVGTRSDDHVILTDLTYRPVAPTYRAKPPRQLLNQLFFVRQETTSTITASATTATETNISFTATLDMQQSAQYLAIFDQYYLHCAIVTITNDIVITGSGNDLPLVYTAIDFDNVNALGSIQAIQAFGTVNQDVLAPGKSVTRVIMPCISTSASTFTGAAVTRLWVDSAFPNVPFYGFRSIVAPVVPTSGVLNVCISVIWAFRNTV